MIGVPTRPTRIPQVKILTRVNSLISTVAFNDTTCIIPLNHANNRSTFKGHLKDDKVLSACYDHKTTVNKTVGLLKVRLPSEVSFTKWKREQPALMNHLKEQKIYLASTTLDSYDTRFLLFLYGVPVTGIDMTDLQKMITVQCTLKCPIALRITELTEQAITAPCFLIECDSANVQHVTTQVFMGLLSPLKNKQWFSHPISRAKPMTLSSGTPYYPACTKEYRAKALTLQRDLIAQQIRFAFINVGTLDVPFTLNNESLTLRSILYDRLTIKGEHMIHGVVPTSPGRILISLYKTTATETLQKLDKLFTQLGMSETKTVEKITGYQDRPRRPGDPTLVSPKAQAYIQSIL